MQVAYSRWRRTLSFPDLPLWAFLFTVPTNGEGYQHCYANHVLMMSGFSIISNQSNLMGKGFLLVYNSRAVANHDSGGVVAGVGGYMVTLHEKLEAVREQEVQPAHET